MLHSKLYSGVAGAVLSAFLLTVPAHAAQAQAAAAAPAAAPTAAKPPSIDELVVEDDVESPELSPSGRYVAFVSNAGKDRRVVVYDTTTGKSEVLITVSKDLGGHFDWVNWKDENRLLVGSRVWQANRRNGEADGQLKSYIYATSVLAMDRDGGNMKTMLSEASKKLSRSSNDFGDVLDLLRNDPDHILIDAPSLNAGQAVWKANIHTGEGEIVAQGDPATYAWLTDRTGSVVGRYDVDNVPGWVKVMVREGQTWRVVRRLTDKDFKDLWDFEFMGPGPVDGQFYVRVKNAPDGGDTATVHLYDLKNDKLGEVVWRHPTLDVDGVVLNTETHEFMGGCFTVDVRRCEYKDPKQAATLRGLEKYFGPQTQLSFVSHSRGQKISLIRASSPENPGTFYLYDWTKRSVDPITAARPGLKAERLAPMEKVTWTTRDGIELSGYLTVPRGAAGKAAPLVVMPHGGPESRDTLSYDPWVQAIAAKGYAVFQPNFRGSGGFGRKFAAAGHGEWGKAMQNDVEDGVDHLIKAGRADAQRMCIFGASYGGYVALYAGGAQPDRYKCVASFAGLSDLRKDMIWEQAYYGKESVVYKYWLKSLGDPYKDSDRLRAASPVEYADAYKAPVLLVHGEHDGNVLIDQSRFMERALKKAGKSVDFVILTEEGHSGWREVNEKAALTKLQDFLAANLGPGVGAP